MPRSAIENWRFEWLTTWNEVWDPSFVNWWQELISQSPDAHVFFEPCLVRAWYETYRELRRIEPRFLIARSDCDCTILFPLVLDYGGWKDAWLRALKPVGFTEFDYHDPICTPIYTEIAWPSFWGSLREELAQRCQNDGFDLVLIPHLRESCVVACSELSRRSEAPFLDISRFESLEDLLSGLSSKLRRDVLRQKRRLASLGKVRLQVFGRNEVDSAIVALQGFLKHHEERWPAAYRPDRFFRRVILHTLPKGLLHMSMLKCDMREISWEIAFVYKRRFYSYVGAFVKEMANYSPGKVHLTCLFEETIHQSFQVFDFLVGIEPYKMRWTSQTTPLYSLSQVSRGVRPAAKNFWQQSVKPLFRAANHFCPWRDR